MPCSKDGTIRTSTNSPIFGCFLASLVFIIKTIKKILTDKHPRTKTAEPQYTIKTKKRTNPNHQEILLAAKTITAKPA